MGLIKELNEGETITIYESDVFKIICTKVPDGYIYTTVTVMGGGMPISTIFVEGEK